MFSRHFPTSLCIHKRVLLTFKSVKSGSALLKLPKQSIQKKLLKNPVNFAHEPERFILFLIPSVCIVAN